MNKKGKSEIQGSQSEYVLALDTSVGVCSVALFNGGQLVSKLHDERQNQQAESLERLVSAVLQEAQIQYEDLAYIAVTRGPGSFTGLRIGMAFALGIKFIRKVEVVAVNTFDAMAMALSWAHSRSNSSLCADEGRYYLSLYAGPGKYYVQQYRALEAVGEVYLCSEPEKGQLPYAVYNRNIDAEFVGLVAFMMRDRGLRNDAGLLYIVEY